jgi:hypothetical protein
MLSQAAWSLRASASKVGVVYRTVEEGEESGFRRWQNLTRSEQIHETMGKSWSMRERDASGALLQAAAGHCIVCLE